MRIQNRGKRHHISGIGHTWKDLPGAPRLCFECSRYECMNELCRKPFRQRHGPFRRYCSLACGNRQRVREAARKP